jgi:hypothetical protein
LQHDTCETVIVAELQRLVFLSIHVQSHGMPLHTLFPW